MCVCDNENLRPRKQEKNTETEPCRNNPIQSHTKTIRKKNKIKRSVPLPSSPMIHELYRYDALADTHTNTQRRI